MFFFFLFFMFKIVKLETIEVTNETFNNLVLNTNNSIVVLFYSPRCPHCISFKPVYNKISNEEIYEGHIEFMKVNCDLLYETCSKEGVISYPTIKLFKGTAGNKTSVSYYGIRKKEEIKTFIFSNV